MLVVGFTAGDPTVKVNRLLLNNVDRGRLLAPGATHPGI